MLCGFLRRVKGEAKHSLYAGSGAGAGHLEWKPHKQTFWEGCGPFALQTKGKC